jgi:phosphatidylglycerophosphatase A
MKFFVGSTFYSSYFFKNAPGTVSSFVVFIAFYFLNPIEIVWKIGILITLLFLHFICFPAFVSRYQTDDPPLYTLDEALSMIFLSIFFYSPWSWTAAFVIFRFFDIVKPLGIRKIETTTFLSHSLRNLGDDLLAAFYTFLLIMGYEIFF